MDFSNENIVHIKKENIEYIQFKKLLKYSDIINHAYILGLDKNFRTARAKGNALTSEEYNLAVKSYQEVCDEFEMEYNNLVKTNQCHTNNVAVVTKKIYEDKPDFGVYKQTDALVTKKKDIILSTTNADCILLLFFDPVKKVIANVHSGWKNLIVTQKI